LTLDTKTAYPVDCALYKEGPQASAHLGAAYKMSTKCRRFTCPSESGSHVVFTFSKISAGTPSPRFPNRCLDGNDKGKENEKRLVRTMSTACA
jgi:hypothetical protein